MQAIAVFVNDLAAARRALQPLLAAADTPTRWVLVACPPLLTRHIGRWVTHGARRQWRERWAAELFGALQPELAAQAGSVVETLIAGRPLAELSEGLTARMPHLRLVDARQVRVGRPDEPITATPGARRSDRWTSPFTAAAGLSLLLALAD